MKYVVLVDSNAIIGNGYKINNKTIKEFFKNNQLVIAEPTFDEVVKNYNRKREEQKNVLIGEIQKAKRIGFEIDFNIKDQDDIEIKLEAELEALNYRLLDIKNADVDLIYKKSLYLEKPFKGKKSKEAGGFRDALIWSLWLQFLERENHKYESIIIINQDSDFVENNKLHGDLIDDLQQRNISAEKLIVLSNMKTFNELTIKEVNTDKKYIGENEIETAEEREFLNFVPEIIKNAKYIGLENAIMDKVKIPKQSDPKIDFLNSNNDIQFGFLHLFDGKQHAYFAETFTFLLSYFLPKIDYHAGNLRNVEVLDYDWNEWFMHVQEEFIVEIGFDVTVDTLNEIIYDSHFYVSDNLVPKKIGSYHDEYIN